MKGHSAMRFRFVLPLPAFVLHPLTAVVVAAVHVYLAAGHLSQLIGGDVQWTHFWKGFGALGGAYVFLALASRGLARQEGRHIHRRHCMAEAKRNGWTVISMKNNWKKLFAFEQ
jgi:hypothetical protein